MTEAKLFDWLKANYFNDLVMARKQFSKWDCYSPKYKARIELKCRKTHYPTLLLERIKYDSLRLKANSHNDKPLYINSTPEGIYVFNLNEVDVNWFIKSLPETTQFLKRNWVKKEVTMLDVNLFSKKIK